MQRQTWRSKGGGFVETFRGGCAVFGQGENLYHCWKMLDPKQMCFKVYVPA